MFRNDLSKKIDNILESTNLDDFQETTEVCQPNNSSQKEFLHETVEVLLNNKRFNESLNEESELTEESFKKVKTQTLKEYTEKCSLSFKSRKQAIKLLFESGKINQDIIFFLEEVQEQEEKEKEINEIVESFEDSLEISFEEKYGDDLDFRTIKTRKEYNGDSIVYNKLNTMSEQDWENYIEVLKESNIQCFYDSIKDCFVVCKCKSPQEIERYSIDPEDSKLIESIVKNTKFKLLETRGLSKSTGKEYVIETIVEKDGYKTIVEYHDTALRKPWRITGREYQFLQEALDSITIPYKSNKQIVPIKKKTLLEEISKKYNNQTDNLPLSESQRREVESKKMISKIDTLHNSDKIIENLTEGVKIKTKKGNGIVRHIDWMDGTFNIDTKKDSNGCGNFISRISFDDIVELN